MVGGREAAHRWRSRPGVVGRVGRYLCHDEIGAEMLAEAGGDAPTTAWAREHHLPPGTLDGRRRGRGRAEGRRRRPRCPNSAALSVILGLRSVPLGRRHKGVSHGRQMAGGRWYRPVRGRLLGRHGVRGVRVAHCVVVPETALAQARAPHPVSSSRSLRVAAWTARPRCAASSEGDDETQEFVSESCSLTA